MVSFDLGEVERSAAAALPCARAVSLPRRGIYKEQEGGIMNEIGKIWGFLNISEASICREHVPNNPPAKIGICDSREHASTAAAACGTGPHDTDSHVQQPPESMAPTTHDLLRTIRGLHCSCFLTVLLRFLLGSSVRCTSSSRTSSHQRTTKGSWFNCKATPTSTDKRNHAPLR